jgi:hypothetical protein
MNMGCGSSKRTAVMPVGDSVGDGEAARSHTRRTSELPVLEGEDPPAEQLKEGSVRPLQNSGNREHMGLYSWIQAAEIWQIQENGDALLQTNLISSQWFILNVDPTLVYLHNAVVGCVCWPFWATFCPLLQGRSRMIPPLPTYWNEYSVILKRSNFWDVMSCSLVGVNYKFSACCLHYTFTLKTEAACTSDTLAKLPTSTVQIPKIRNFYCLSVWPFNKSVWQIDHFNDESLNQIFTAFTSYFLQYISI